MLHDLWFALRRIRLRPLHSAMVALTLALGIGASLAVFAVVDAVILRPLPYPDASRLVSITHTIPIPGIPELPFSDVTYRRLVTDGHSLSAIGAWQTRDANLVRPNESRRLSVGLASAGLFKVLQVTPQLGRVFTAEEDVEGGARVLVLSDWLWRSAFNADPSVLGSSVNLEGEPFTIVGVLAPSVSFPSRDIAGWQPLQLSATAINPTNNNYSVIGRLRDGVSLDDASRDLTAPVRAVGREFPGPHAGSALDAAGFKALVKPLADTIVGDVRPTVMLLLAGVLMLLVLTCANVANLQLAGVIVRSEELAVRASLGATRARLIRGALIEGTLLAGAGAVVGFGIATVGAKLLAGLLPAGISATGTVLGTRALVVVAIAVLLIGAVVGAVPVMVVSGRDPAKGLRDRTAGATPASANMLRRVLAIGQVALAVLLLHSSGLLIASARAVREVKLGFSPVSTVTMRINLPESTMRDRNAREGLLRRLISDIGQQPGVTAVGLVNALPLTPGRENVGMAVEGRPFKADGTDPIADYRVVSNGYFAAMQIPLQRGRLFTDDDATDRNTPLVISERLAKRLFPDGEDPLGKRLRFGPFAPWMPIVGVVAEAKNRSLTEEARAEFYTPGLGSYSNLSFRSEITIVARSRGDALALVAPIRRIVSAAAPEVAIYNVFTMDEIVRDASSRMAATTRLMSGYAVTALLLSLAGIFAVLSYLVTQRKQELAVRMALGASPRDIVTLVARESVLLVGGGAVIGLAGAVATAQLLHGLLYGVGVLNLSAVLLVVVSAVLTGFVATLLPARRASLADPSTALRSGG
ncbi:MAG: ABC transporter permease [Gemmatimonadales bacterium]